MGIVGPQIYQSKFGPTYKVSYSASIGLLVGALFAISTAWVLVKRGDSKGAQNDIEGASSADESQTSGRVEKSRE
jgi:hypothetical protein